MHKLTLDNCHNAPLHAPHTTASMVMKGKCHFSTNVVDHRTAHGHRSEQNNEGWLVQDNHCGTPLLSVSVFCLSLKWARLLENAGIRRDPDIIIIILNPLEKLLHETNLDQECATSEQI